MSAFCWNIPYFVLTIYNENFDFCMEDFPSMAYPQALSLLNLFAYGIIPITIMGILYGKVIQDLWFGRSAANAATQQAMLKSRKHVTKMLVLVSVIYCFSWLPNAVVLPLQVRKHPLWIPLTSKDLTHIALLKESSRRVSKRMSGVGEKVG